MVNIRPNLHILLSHFNIRIIEASKNLEDGRSIKNMKYIYTIFALKFPAQDRT